MSDKSAIEWTEARCAYVAGLIDGEGSIHPAAGPARPSDLPGVVRRIAYPAITVAMTHRGVIDWLGELLGVRVQLHNHTNLRRHQHYRPQWKVTITGASAIALCERVLPHLRVKHEQALLVTSWPRDARLGRGRRMDDVEWLAREECADGLRALNGLSSQQPLSRVGAST